MVMWTIHGDESLHGANYLSAGVVVLAAGGAELQDHVGDAAPGLVLVEQDADQAIHLSREAREDLFLLQFLMVVPSENYIRAKRW